MSDLYSLSQDALDAATKVPYELSPQDMFDKLIDGFYLMPAEATHQYCLEHDCGVLDRHDQCWVARWTKPENECYVVDVVRINE